MFYITVVDRFHSNYTVMNSILVYGHFNGATFIPVSVIEIGSQIQNDNMSITDWMRLVAITSFTEAIERTITPWNVSSAFKRSCLFPFDPNMIINNSFVIDASNPSPTRPRGYVCSGKVVTDLDELQRMYISLLPRRPQSHITMVKIDHEINIDTNLLIIIIKYFLDFKNNQ